MYSTYCGYHVNSPARHIHDSMFCNVLEKMSMTIFILRIGIFIFRILPRGIFIPITYITCYTCCCKTIIFNNKHFYLRIFDCCNTTHTIRIRCDYQINSSQIPYIIWRTNCTYNEYYSRTYIFIIYVVWYYLRYFM